MIRSMTAFGRSKRENEHVAITVEIKSVNSRYFDFSSHLPRDYSFMEERIRNYIHDHVTTRGKVEVSVSLERKESSVTSVTLDTALADGYYQVLDDLRVRYSLPPEATTYRIVENPNLFIFKKGCEDEEKEWEEFLPVLQEACLEFAKARIAEGKRTENDFREKMDYVQEIVDLIEEKSNQNKSMYYSKLLNRLKQTLADENIQIDEQRILTECAIFSDKIAVDEEIARLRSHFEAFLDILTSNEPSGRRLDFLMQEMNRETNTIGSKSCDANIARHVVDIKCELEKIREQIQNIE